ncbi:MAG: serine/threonine protein kinase [Planctomycetes bacterium]|nr:serine/threonine protein kinase [Planctomycetota bacterium]
MDQSEVRKLFDELVQSTDAEREIFLAGLDDVDLRAALRELLEHHRRSEQDGFLDPATGPMLDDSRVGHVFGDYRIERRIGGGGMGDVYEAVRTRDFERRVAIKFLRRGGDPAEIQRLYRREARSQGALEHPGIAKLLDAGVTADGQAYLVMEYVDGQHLDAYCDAQAMSIRERVRLFAAVCDAVDFAHRSGIIHRDLKPGNILVADGVPKLVDFGIATLVDSDATNEATRTEFRRYTPLFASPEQHRGIRATTASDQYSLGVVLYQLLSGQLPYDLEGLDRVGVHDVVCNRDPQLLRTALARATQRSKPPSGPDASLGIDDVVRRRSTTEKQLSGQLRGELETIVLKTLAKKPEDRYPSVEQFGADLRNYLEGRPVVAKRHSMRYVMGKFVRRHKLAVGSSVALLATLIAALWITIFALADAKAARRIADAATTNEQAARRMAEHQVDRTLDVIDELLVEITAGTTLNRLVVARVEQNPLAGVRRALLEKAEHLLGELGEFESKFPAVQGQGARTLMFLANVNGQLGKDAQAIAYARRALETAEAYGRAQASDATSVELLGSAHRVLGTLLQRSKEVTQAVVHFRKAIEYLESLGTDRTLSNGAALSLAHVHSHLGVYYQDVPDYEAATKAYLRAASLHDLLIERSPGSREFRLARCEARNNHANVLSQTGHMQESADLLRKNEEDLRELTKLFPEDPELRLRQAYTTQNLAYAEAQLGRVQQGADMFASTSEPMRILSEAHRDNPQYATVYAQAEFGAASLTLDAMSKSMSATPEQVADSLKLARSRLEKAIEVLGGLLARFPDHVPFQATQAGQVATLASVLMEQGEVDAANTTMESATEMHRRLAQSHPDVIGFQLNYIASLGNEAELAQLQGRMERALDLSEKTLEQLAALPISMQKHPRVLQPTYNAHRVHALALGSFERFEEASAAWLTALEIGGRTMDHVDYVECAARSASTAEQAVAHLERLIPFEHPEEWSIESTAALGSALTLAVTSRESLRDRCRTLAKHLLAHAARDPSERGRLSAKDFELIRDSSEYRDCFERE